MITLSRRPTLLALVLALLLAAAPGIVAGPPPQATAAPSSLRAVSREVMGFFTAAERDYMRLHVGRRSWLIHHSMNALEEGLDPELFVRLHRSAIVRKDFITGFTRNPSGRWIARLGDGVEQPVGRLYTDKVRSIAKR